MVCGKGKSSDMAFYIVNRHSQPNGDFEVHRTDICSHLPVDVDRIPLGDFYGCQEAITYARQMFPQYANRIDGCYYCCNACHTH